MALLTCNECGNQVSTNAAACPKCGAPVTVSAMEAVAEPTAAGAPAAAPAKKGMSKGCMTALGCGACLFVGVVMVGGGAGIYGFQRYRAEQRRSELMAKLTREMEMDRQDEEKILAKNSEKTSEKSYEKSYATPAPTATPIDEYAELATIPTPAPLKPKAFATPVRPAATPKPVQHVALAVATPRPAPTPRPAASHGGLGLSGTGTPVSSTRSLAVSEKKTVTVTAKPAPTALPWEDPADTVPAAIAANSTVKSASPAVTAAVKAAPAVVAAAAPVVAAAPVAPAPTLAPKPTPAPDPNARIIHSQAGEKPVELNKNIALTGSDGKTVVGVLVQVKDGFVDVRVSGQVLRIAERDVLDAAAY